MRKVWLLMLLGIAVVGVRVGEWELRERGIWQPGNLIGQEVRLEEEVTHSSQGDYFRYRNHAYFCDIRNKECQSIKAFGLGDEISFNGEVVVYNERLELKISHLTGTKKIGKWSIWQLIRGLRLFRSRLVNIYKLTLSEPHASLLAGIVLGRNERMPDELYQALINTGTVHIVAASGFNVTIVAKVVMSSLLLFCTRGIAIVSALIAVAIYVGLAGAGPAVVRAGIMGSLVFIAQAFGKDYWAAWGLGLTSGLMLILWPWLITDLSFQLSVAATGGILFMSEKIRKRIFNFKFSIFPAKAGSRLRENQISNLKFKTNERNKNKLADSLISDLATTLAAGITTAPIIWAAFGRVAWISPLVNVMVLWLVAPLMALGAIVAGLGLISLPLAQVMAWFTWPLTQLMIQIILVFSRVGT